jgi:putative tryptophan/tyrosine transport system substrate-binding protein
MADPLARRSIARAVLGGAFASFLSSCASSAVEPRTPRIGFMIGTGYPTMEAAFHDELRRLGYIEGQSLIVETRISTSVAELQAQAAQLAQMDLELIVAAALPQALAVRAANPNMPMVVGTAAGLVENGFAESLERPGGNVTGMDELPPGLTGTRLRLLKQAAPSIARVALLSTTPGRGGHEAQLADAEAAAAELGLSVTAYRASSVAEIETALGSIARDRMEGMLNFQGGLSLGRREEIVRFAAEHRIPAMYQSRLFAEAGGLMAYAPDQDDQFRTAARYVDLILKGAAPGELAIQHPSRYYLTINIRAAHALHLNLPAVFLDEADRLLE